MKILTLQNCFKRGLAKFYTRLLRGEAGKIGLGSLVYFPFHSTDISGLEIGKNSVIFSYGWILTVSEGWGVKYSPKVEIGDNVYIGFRCHIIACNHIKIGNRTVLADNVYITDNFHGFEDIAKGVMEQPLRVPGPVIIEDEVWIGERVCIMPNVTIGRHSVIGANSVVTKNIPPYSVAVGSPAVVMKQYNHESGQWESCRTK